VESLVARSIEGKRSACAKATTWQASDVWSATADSSFGERVTIRLCQGYGVTGVCEAGSRV
jgi:hypothetical protein